MSKETAGVFVRKPKRTIVFWTVVSAMILLEPVYWVIKFNIAQIESLDYAIAYSLGLILFSRLIPLIFCLVMLIRCLKWRIGINDDSIIKKHLQRRSFFLTPMLSVSQFGTTLSAAVRSLKSVFAMETAGKSGQASEIMAGSKRHWSNTAR